MEWLARAAALPRLRKKLKNLDKLFKTFIRWVIGELTTTHPFLHEDLMRETKRSKFNLQVALGFLTGYTFVKKFALFLLIWVICTLTCIITSIREQSYSGNRTGNIS